MGARVVLIAVITFGLMAQGSAPVVAGRDRLVTIRIVVDGRLLGKKATLRIYDGEQEKKVTVRTSRKVRVHAGRTTIVPFPIPAGRASTATIQQFDAEAGSVVRFRYKKDATSRPGPLAPLANGRDGSPATGWDWVPSPDGSQLAFTSRDPGLLAPGQGSGLFVRDLATGVVTKAADDADGGISWSPDSRRIAFVTDAGLLSRDDNGRVDAYVKDLGTGDVLLASVHSDGTPFHAAPQAAWADDDHVAFSGCDTAQQYRDGFCGVHVRTLSTDVTRLIVPADYRAERWRVAPDGRRLLFESEGDPLDLGILRRALYVTDLATADTTLLSANRKGRPAHGEAWGAVWAPASDTVAFRSTAANLVPGDTNGRKDPSRGTDVFIKDLGSGIVTRVSTTSSGRQMRGEPPRDEPAVQWAPDGKMVAFRFASGGGSTQSAVFLKHLASGKLEPLIPRSVTLPRSPAVGDYVFSPSGGRIAFLFGPRNGCWTDLVPFANLNCHNVLVRNVGSRRLANVSTLDTGLGWLGGPADRRVGEWAPVWLRDDQLVFLAPDPAAPRTDAFPVIKTVKWPPAVVRSPAPWVPSWCDPNRYWWSC